MAYRLTSVLSHDVVPVIVTRAIVHLIVIIIVIFIVFVDDTVILPIP